MKPLILALMTPFAVPALAEAPAGAAGLDCDITQFTAIRGDDGQILYWNNPTCSNGPGGMDSAFRKPPPVEDPGDEEKPVKS